VLRQRTGAVDQDPSSQFQDKSWPDHAHLRILAGGYCKVPRKSGNFLEVPTGLCDRMGYREGLTEGRVNRTKEGNLTDEGTLEGDRAGERMFRQEQSVVDNKRVNTPLIDRS